MTDYSISTLIELCNKKELVEAHLYLISQANYLNELNSKNRDEINKIIKLKEFVKSYSWFIQNSGKDRPEGISDDEYDIMKSSFRIICNNSNLNIK